MMDTDNRFDFTIVGGGSIGASTVYAVITEWPDARVAWFAGKHERTASNDFIKIIRDAYPEEVTSKFANRALQKWMNTPPYCDYFHKTAWIQAIGSDTKRKMKGPNDKALTAAEMTNAVGSTVKPILTAGEGLYLNPNVGYADSALAVQAVSDKVVELGVQRYEKNVTRLIIEEGRCLGVEVGGFVITATQKTIVSVGAWTPSLLEKSNISIPPDFFSVTAVGVAILSLSEEEFDVLKSMPILVAENGEIMLSRREKVLKINTTETFRIRHPDQLSDAVDISANRDVLEKMLPQFKGRDLDSFICPDLLTPYQNPIVDDIPGIERLIVATGGSYHSYKFLPSIGDMVVLRIRGQQGRDAVESALLERWRWERPEGTESVHPNIVPQGS